MVDQVLPARRLVTVRDAGHAVTMDNPAEFMPVLFVFFRNCDGSAQSN